MSRFVWSPEYELGIEVIDHQHQRIIEYINQIYDARSRAAAQDSLAVILPNLVDYTLSHFAFEEALLEEVDYPELSEHQLTHQHFAKLIGAMKARFDRGEAIAEELATILQHWLIDHIMSDDQQYAPVVKQRLLGIQPDQQQSWVRQAVSRYFQ
ncbi:bacteriohemerythrin [Spongiibacter tropicus]|uniref:bacteriohemerythrin n=1 Tax=Spongiibacter tropicus TaxID=454602 RepID=UPI0003B6777D|nr:bacteriohemerythrin [Spongiibacter tropicus]